MLKLSRQSIYRLGPSTCLEVQHGPLLQTSALIGGADRSDAVSDAVPERRTWPCSGGCQTHWQQCIRRYGLEEQTEVGD